MPASASQPASYTAILCAPCLFEPSRLICLFDFLTPLPLSALTFLITRLSKPFFSSPSGLLQPLGFAETTSCLPEGYSVSYRHTSRQPHPQAVYLQASELSFSSFLSSINPSFCLFTSPSVNLSIPPFHPVHPQAFTKGIGHHHLPSPFSHFELSPNYFSGLLDRQLARSYSSLLSLFCSHSSPQRLLS